GEGQVDDVVRVEGEVLRVLGRGDDVVGRSDERLQRTRLCLVVAHRRERTDVRHGRETSNVAAIVSLAEDRVVEGVYAVARKERLRTRSGSPYLSLELVDQSGRIEARVWNDVELLDGRFGEGDAVRVLGRVERFRDRLQLDVRTLEAAPQADPGELTPQIRRDRDELEGFLEFLVGE